MNSFSKAISQAFNSVKAIAGVDLKYVRGAVFTNLKGVPGLSDFTVDDGNGVVAEYRSRDFIFATAELTFDGDPITPKRGDQIIEEVGNQLHTYEVSRPDGSEQVWRFSDHGRTRIRVHTKLKGISDK